MGSGGLMPGGIIGLLPLGTVEHLVLVFDIVHLVLDDLHTSVVDVETSLGLLDVLLESKSEVLPLSHELLTLWGGKEFLVELLEGGDLLGAVQSLEGVLDVSGWLGVSDLLEGWLDIVGLVFDLSLSGLGDSDLEGVDGVLELLSVGGGNDSKEKGNGEFHCGRWLFVKKNIFNYKNSMSVSF